MRGCNLLHFGSFPSKLQQGSTYLEKWLGSLWKGPKPNAPFQRVREKQVTQPSDGTGFSRSPVAKGGGRVLKIIQPWKSFSNCPVNISWEFGKSTAKQAIVQARPADRILIRHQIFTGEDGQSCPPIAVVLKEADLSFSRGTSSPRSTHSWLLNAAPASSLCPGVFLYTFKKYVPKSTGSSYRGAKPDYRVLFNVMENRVL